MTTFTVSENIDWIDENSCVQSRTADATFIRCGLNSVPVGLYTEAVANSALVLRNGSYMPEGMKILTGCRKDNIVHF